VEIEQSKAVTPVGPPLTTPWIKTVIDPPVPRMGPGTGVLMGGTLSPLQAQALSDAASAAITISEAPASNAALRRLLLFATVKAGVSERRARPSGVSQVLIGLMTTPFKE
jgi:hypothetical protein